MDCLWKSNIMPGVGGDDYGKTFKYITLNLQFLFLLFHQLHLRSSGIVHLGGEGPWL